MVYELYFSKEISFNKKSISVRGGKKQLLSFI